MKPVVRNIIFYVFLAAFLIIAPLLVLYTAGYRYNAGSGQVIRTGVLSVSTVPRGATILLDNKTLKRDTPYVIKHMNPGTYLLTLEKEDYHTWSGEVEVPSGETTTVHNVLLLRDAPAELLFEQPTAEITLSPDGDQVAYLLGSAGQQEIWLYSTRNHEPQLIGRYAQTEDSTATLSWSVNGEYLLYQNVSTGDLAVYDNNGDAIKLSSELASDWQSATWHPSADQLLCLATPAGQQQYDLETATITSFADSAQTTLLDASTISFVDNGSQIELRQTTGDQNQLIALLPQAPYQLELRSGSYLIITTEQDQLYLIDIHASQPILLNTTATLFDWSESQQELVFSNGYEINVYDPNNHNTDFINRQSETLTQLRWHSSGSYILASTKTRLSAIERYKVARLRQTFDLLVDLEVLDFAITENGRDLLLYTSQDGMTQLQSLALTH